MALGRATVVWTRVGQWGCEKATEEMRWRETGGGLAERLRGRGVKGPWVLQLPSGGPAAYLAETVGTEAQPGPWREQGGL